MARVNEKTINSTAMTLPTVSMYFSKLTMICKKRFLEK